MADVDSRDCTKCGAHKPLSMFNRAARGKYGHQSVCRACMKAYSDAYREQHGEEINARSLAKYHAKQEPRRQAKIAAKTAKLMSETKRCPRCGETKNRSEFGKSSHTADGQRNYCKPCACAVNTASRQRNIENAKAAEQRWRDANKEAVRIKGKRWRQANHERTCETARKWRAANPEKTAEINKRNNKRRRKDHSFRIRKSISEGIRLALNGRKIAKTFEMLGYTLAELMTHLQKQFQRGMTFDNFGKWHIDHIRPLSSFKITSATDDDFKAAWALSNLRPLWAIDNLRKHAKLTHLI